MLKCSLILVPLLQNCVCLRNLHYAGMMMGLGKRSPLAAGGGNQSKTLYKKTIVNAVLCHSLSEGRLNLVLRFSIVRNCVQGGKAPGAHVNIECSCQSKQEANVLSLYSEESGQYLSNLTSHYWPIVIYRFQ